MASTTKSGSGLRTSTPELGTTVWTKNTNKIYTTKVSSSCPSRRYADTTPSPSPTPTPTPIHTRGQKSPSELMKTVLCAEHGQWR